MDFAKKQLEKFGWKEGTGLGKNEQGMLTAIKPTLKVGKEGMGFDYSKDLVDDWWTRAYDDSLNRIDVNNLTDESVGVTLQDDEDGDSGSSKNGSARPFQKMKKRMMKANFTDFSKGATLSNGQMVAEEIPESTESKSQNSETDKPKAKTMLTDEELLEACGGRTAHKAARFGLKLNGKLARIAAQEEAAKALLAASAKRSNVRTEEIAIEEESIKKKKKKSKKRRSSSPDPILPEDALSPSLCSAVLPVNAEDEESERRKKAKKSKKQKCSDADDDETARTNSNNNEISKETEQYDKNKIHKDSEEEESRSISKTSKKKSKKKHKKYNDEDECPLLE